MTIKLAGMKLKDYCGYRDTEINLLNDQDQANNIVVIYGPNGIGKSTLIKAIQLVSNPFLYEHRNSDKIELLLKKLVYNDDYDPSYSAVYEQAGGQSKYNMQMHGVFDDESKQFKSVIMEQNGLQLCELEKKHKGYAYYIDADNPVNMSRFQLEGTYKEQFLEIANIVYGYECNLAESIEEFIEDEYGNNQMIELFNDFTLNKNGTLVHFKSMSAGEKKIATLLSSLCDPNYINILDIVLIDNIAMHVYFKRHASMIDKILEFFPNKQFIVTTHSETLIKHVRATYGENCLLDLETIKEG